MASPWQHGAKPAEPGWYPVLICWDAAEGSFPRTCYWHEARQESIEVADAGTIIAFAPQRFAGEAAAQEWAWQHDRDR